MHDRFRSRRPTLGRRAPVLLAAALVASVMVTACGGTAGTTASRTTANAAATTTTGSSTTTSGAGSSGLPTAPPAGSALAFARCMRANGVPNFPDPLPGRGLLFNATGINPSAPAVTAAHAKCRKLLPGGGPPGPGAQMHPTAQTLAKLVRISRCMRDHGVPQFPDPRTSIPSDLGGIAEVTIFDQAILLFPDTFNLQAPAYRQALTACHAPPLGLHH